MGLINNEGGTRERHSQSVDGVRRKVAKYRRHRGKDHFASDVYSPRLSRALHHRDQCALFYEVWTSEHEMTRR